MIEKIVIAVVVTLFIFSIVIIWKKSEKISESLLMKLLNKKSTKSMDIDNLIRFLILILWAALIWTPVIYVLSLIFD